MAIILGETGRNDVCLRLGKQGEHDVTFFEFDFTQWATDYGDGVLSLRLTPNGSATAYPVTLDFDGTVATFTVTATDTATAGLGSAELVYIVGDDEKLKKSVSYVTSVEPSDDTGEAPEPYDEWLAHLEVLAGETSQAKTDAEQAASEAKASEQAAAISEQNAKTFEDNAEEYADRIINLTVSAHEATGETPTVIKTIVNDVYNLDFGLVPGKDGKDGEDGADGVGIASVALNSDYTLTITLTDGRTYTTTSIRGEQGETGATPDFTIGTVTTLAPGSQATATITGTDEEPVLNLGIPKGDPGDVSSIGYYPDLYAGGLVTDKGDTDTSPYTFRASKALGYRESLNQIVGATVGWNQLRHSLLASACTMSEANGVITVTPSSGNRLIASAKDRTSQQVVAGHKYLNEVWIKSDGTNNVGFQNYLIGGSKKISANTWVLLSDINNATSTGLATFQLYSPNNTEYQIKKDSYVIHDLTALFNPTIADYIYSLEQSQAGAGVAWFRQYFPEDYYPYHSVSLESVQATAHKTYDADDNVIGNYALDSSLTLRGIPKLDASNNLYYDGDTYASDGTVTRKYSIVDLGTLNWNTDTDATWGRRFFSTDLANSIKRASTGYDIPSIATKKYVATSLYGSTGIFAQGTDMCISVSTAGAVSIKDSTYTDLSTFKTAMSGVYLVYELATPTTETADPYQQIQICDPDGTEAFVDYGIESGDRDVAIPCGHETFYPEDLKGKLEDIPDIPEAPASNGTYTLKAVRSNSGVVYSWVSG